MADEKKTAATAKHRQQETRRNKALPIAGVVGIGSSAGGLEALTQFFTAMLEDSGLAFVLIRFVTDHDFSQHQKNTIRRRIERRMYVHQIDTIDQYVDYLQESLREMARPGLRAGLSHAIRKMSAERAEISIRNLRVQNNGDTQDINLIVRPLAELHQGGVVLMH